MSVHFGFLAGGMGGLAAFVTLVATSRKIWLHYRASVEREREERLLRLERRIEANKYILRQTRLFLRAKPISSELLSYATPQVQDLYSVWRTTDAKRDRLRLRDAIFNDQRLLGVA